MMQDRFRFRAWHKKYKKMYKILSLNVGSIGTPESCFNVWANVKGYCCIEDKDIMINIQPKYIIVMQCTGLKDKNGKLIYEGDIVVIPNQYPYFDYPKGVEKNLNDTFGKIEGECISNYVGIVEFIYSQWQVVYKCVNSKKVGCNDGINNSLNDVGFEENENSHWEVIGNIYENPELLEAR